jgi:hypothetical protein
MKRLAIVVLLLMVAGCSSRAKPNANGTQSATGTSVPSADSSASLSPSAQPGRPAGSVAPSVATSTRSTSKPKTVAPGAVVPAPGTYHYNQSGSVQAGVFSFNADPQGTLGAGGPLASGDGQQQTQQRVYSSSWSQQQVLLFRPTGVYIKAITTRFGSGGFVQEDTCTPSHPIKAIALPLAVGSSWSDQATCNGRTVKLSGKVLRTETRTVGGTQVGTDVVNIVTSQTGNGYNVALNLTMWIAPRYGLSVHSTTTGSGSAQGYNFKENLTEDLIRLTPDP